MINMLLKPAITSEGAAGAIVAAIKSGRRHYCYPAMLSVGEGRGERPATPPRSARLQKPPHLTPHHSTTSPQGGRRSRVAHAGGRAVAHANRQPGEPQGSEMTRGGREPKGATAGHAR